MSTFLFNKTGISSNDRVVHEFAQGQILGQQNNVKVQNLLHTYNNYESFIVYYV